MKARPKVYLFNWPSALGGADTKVAHLLRLLHADYDWTVIPNSGETLRKQWRWRRWMERMGVRTAAWGDLPRKLSGTGLSICNTWWLTDGRIAEAKQRGLRLVWGSEMMWHHTAELGAVAAGLLDAVLYVSGEQRAALEPGYAGAAGAEIQNSKFQIPNGELSGHLGRLAWQVVGNYIDPAAFPFCDRFRGRRRWDGEFVIGRLSRADPAKYPRDFPDTYARLRLRPSVRCRVMAWSEALTKLFPLPATPGLTWELLPPLAEEPARFLRSLDLLVYDLGTARESWGRSTVEAMLTGAVPLIPADPRHHLYQLVPHGAAGFHCRTPGEWGTYARWLQEDTGLRRKMSRTAREWAEHSLCNAQSHRAAWREALSLSDRRK